MVNYCQLFSIICTWMIMEYLRNSLPCPRLFSNDATLKMSCLVYQQLDCASKVETSEKYLIIISKASHKNDFKFRIGASYRGLGQGVVFYGPWNFFRNSGHATVYIRIWLLLRLLHIVLAIFHSFPINNERESVYIPSHDKKDIFCVSYLQIFINKSRINFWALSRYTVIHHPSDIK